MKMKKLFALALAGAMLASMSTTAFAAEPPATASEFLTLFPQFEGVLDIVEVENGFDYIVSRPDGSITVVWYRYPSSSSSEPYVETEADREARAEALAAKEIGIPLETIYAAREEDKSISEYMNNFVDEVFDLDEVVPVGQGGSVIVNGEETNQTFTIAKAYYAYTKFAKEQAASVGGTAINVVDVKSSMYFDNATVNFYMPGVTADRNIQIFRYVDGAWESQEITEIREDHVVANLTGPGVLVFVEVQ